MDFEKIPQNRGQHPSQVRIMDGVGDETHTQIYFGGQMDSMWKKLHKWQDNLAFHMKSQLKNVPYKGKLDTLRKEEIKWSLEEPHYLWMNYMGGVINIQ